MHRQYIQVLGLLVTDQIISCLYPTIGCCTGSAVLVLSCLESRQQSTGPSYSTSRLLISSGSYSPLNECLSPLRCCTLENYVQKSENIPDINIPDICTYLKGKLCIEILDNFRYAQISCIDIFSHIPRYLIVYPQMSIVIKILLDTFFEFFRISVWTTKSSERQ
jgi:hypothetical protein